MPPRPPPSSSGLLPPPLAFRPPPLPLMSHTTPLPLPPPRPTPPASSRPSPSTSSPTSRSKSPPPPPPLPPFLMGMICGNPLQDVLFPNCQACKTISDSTTITKLPPHAETNHKPSESLGSTRWFGMRFFPTLEQHKKERGEQREQIAEVSRRIDRLEARLDKNKR